MNSVLFVFRHCHKSLIGYCLFGGSMNSFCVNDCCFASEEKRRCFGRKMERIKF
jgi:hypothetical protein